MVKKGDTLVEVTIAIGIFSMVAIAIAAAMNGGNSSAQTALEATLAREQIDAQAEAIRFIHSSYANYKGFSNKENPFIKLWDTIKSQANNPSDSDNDPVTHFAVTSCENLYNRSNSENLFSQKAFFIDTNKLDDLTKTNEIVITANDNNNISKFAPASTYPRLVYSGTEGGSLLSNGFDSQLFRSEGLYVVAVKDSGTNLIDEAGDNANSSAFYDFYIRACWQGADSSPSTISTVIRLNDPETQTGTSRYFFDVNFHDGTTQRISNTRRVDFRDYTKNREGFIFMGWCDTVPDGESCPGKLYTKSDVLFSDIKGRDYDFYAIWKPITYTIRYDGRGGSWSGNDATTRTVVCSYTQIINQGQCAVKDDGISRSGYIFKGWCQGIVNSDATCDGKTYEDGYIIYDPAPTTDGSLSLQAMWAERNETITIKLTWNSYTDFDSYIVGTKSSGESFTAYYSNKKPTETVSGVTRTLAELDHDCTGSCRDETFTINTLGGRNFYYFVRNYSNSNSITDATVVVSGPYLGTYTFKASDATGNGRVWNVFAYKNGQIVPRQTRTYSSSSSGVSNAETSY